MCPQLYVDGDKIPYGRSPEFAILRCLERLPFIGSPDDFNELPVKLQSRYLAYSKIREWEEIEAAFGGHL